ncbi:uncharacterized protein HMPREF1541_08812 [Cyphellophora europaea CBS 101466]|uniref:Myb-like domain-containing protein n=1 Tax=Cyphellophora europaea (strain CBS 101466) TaxID=1220924 RepID=W2RLC9_CYPE1|nr:uncharacterized protein HMPREF1541_08812 [Cyphellophora europaea CBS 101466]ETN36534.1 hypothetical protein HMPREF1541_08812 [Cyphellophora europaea CBS 101466]
MSFRAVYTDKTGKQKIVEVPWYAAFSPGPVRKVKQIEPEKPCTHCHGRGKEIVKDGKPSAQVHFAHDKETYTKADNKKIRAMKSENKSWKEILDAINKKSLSQLKEHYKNDLQGDGNAADVAAGAQVYSAHAKETYTKGDDKVIVEMKNAGKTWGDILSAIKKESQSQLKEHYKNNLKDGNGAADNGTGGSTHEKETYSKANNKTIIQMKNADKPWDEILKAIDKKSKSQLIEHYKTTLKERAEQAKGNGGDGKKAEAQAYPSGSKKGAVDPKVAELAKESGHRRWQDLCSRHFDETGERLTTAEARRRYPDYD